MEENRVREEWNTTAARFQDTVRAHSEQMSRLRIGWRPLRSCRLEENAVWGKRTFWLGWAVLIQDLEGALS